MTREPSPCFTCVKRCLLCHAQCEEYAAWVQRQKDRRQQVRQKNVGGFEADNFRWKQQQKRKKKYNQSSKK